MWKRREGMMKEESETIVVKEESETSAAVVKARRIN